MTVLRDFYSCVCEHDKENEWIFLLNKKFFEETDNVRIIALPDIKKNPVKKLLFDFISGKRYIESLKPDIVFSMQNIITFGIKKPQVVYLHQSLPFQNIKKFSFLKKAERSTAIKQRLVGRIIKFSAKKADRVIVQTEWMREAVCRECSLDIERVIKCQPVCAQMPSLNQEAVYHRSAFFYPTSMGVYKNNRLVFEASSILAKQGIAHSVEMTIDKSLSSGAVQCIGRIPFDQVIEKYQTSTLVFPSYIETFGYPLAEARKMCSIILASDTPFSREVLAGYENAYFFPFDKPEYLALLMENVVSGKIERKATQYSGEIMEDGNSWLSVMRCVYQMAQR